MKRTTIAVITALFLLAHEGTSIPSRVVQIRGLSVRPLAVEYGIARYSWKCVAVNSSSHDVRGIAYIRFFDRDGYQVEGDSTGVIDLGPGERRSITAMSGMTAEMWTQVASYSAYFNEWPR